MSNYDNIGALSSLLRDCQEAGEPPNHHLQPPIASGKTVIKAGNEASTAVNKKDEKSIWEAEEIPSEDTVVAVTKDGRPSPKYEISFKQSIGTEDTFLGLSDKTPLTDNCTHLVIKVHFPGCKMRDLDLDVTKNRIKAESQTLRLFTYLPRSVDHENGSAKFDTKRELLIVTLPIIED